MPDGILGAFGSVLSAAESLKKRRDALRDAFGQKMMGEERWKAFKTFKERRKKPQQGPQSPGGNYPQRTLGSDFLDIG